jgi:uncharacterized protein YecT (DUF1311 family)
MKRLAGGASSLLLLLAAVPARAEPSAALQDCLNHVIDNEHGSRWPAVTFCYDNELAAQERRLDAAYRALEEGGRKLSAQTLALIADSRLHWTAYRDAWCAFEQDYASAPTASIARLACRIDVTKGQLSRVTEMSLPAR